MKLNITISTDFDRQAAGIIAEGLLAGQTVGLSTGRTTGEMHRLAAEMLAGRDVSRATVFGLDEVTGVDRMYAGACYAMLWNEIVSHIALPEANFLMLPTRAPDWSTAAREFEAALDARGGIDLLMLGLGENGHLGFNQPGTPFGQDTFAGRMHPELEERIRRETGSEGDLGGITLGIRNIMHARRIVLVAKGAGKAEVVRRILKGPVDEQWPGSVLQLHPNCEFLLDAEAAAMLNEK